MGFYTLIIHFGVGSYYTYGIQTDIHGVVRIIREFSILDRMVSFVMVFEAASVRTLLLQ